MENKLGQEPAFPCEVAYEDGQMQQQHQNGNTTALDNGMSRRFYAACAAMQGMLSNSSLSRSDNYNSKFIASEAYSMADELLKQENNEKTT